MKGYFSRKKNACIVLHLCVCICCLCVLYICAYVCIVLYVCVWMYACVRCVYEYMFYTCTYACDYTCIMHTKTLQHNLNKYPRAKNIKKKYCQITQNTRPYMNVWYNPKHSTLNLNMKAQYNPKTSTLCVICTNWIYSRT
mgnify:CR=1 FL=1